jgi:hypothetical protein
MRATPLNCAPFSTLQLGGEFSAPKQQHLVPRESRGGNPSTSASLFLPSLIHRSFLSGRIPPSLSLPSSIFLFFFLFPIPPAFGINASSQQWQQHWQRRQHGVAESNIVWPSVRLLTPPMCTVMQRGGRKEGKGKGERGERVSEGKE